ncbi:DUF1433 domain-containing protein [Sediminibacillus dalangtanensis]|uniref:DUF1433 domain-containing protein n=1 Tax=Sediminibacillus dalangtanensis TaxID=2729421 RepID=A0ABX7VP68_9BACI|nr:DUF1433 domain-containing protein [Sediminibacillus dalangtanensis]QTM98243.1 DUF1433 domain-containing protein [Sediminibacillus dalangtanensis]
MNSNKNNFDEETINKAKETVESYLYNNYENIRTVEFSNDMSDPMGGLMIRGTVNGKSGFSASVDPQEFTVNSLGEKEGFPKVKDECKEKVCDY